MMGVRVEIVRYANDSFPGWVECSLTDLRGHRWSFVEKVPIVTTACLDATSPYPQPGVIACEVVSQWRDSGRQVLAIDTELPWHVEATTGETRFEVNAEQVIEFDWGWPAEGTRHAEPDVATDGGA